MNRLPFKLLTILILLGFVSTACGIKQEELPTEPISTGFNQIYIEVTGQFPGTESEQGLVRLPGYGWGAWILVSSDNMCILIVTIWPTSSNQPYRFRFEKSGPCDLVTVQKWLDEFKVEAQKINIPDDVLDTLVSETIKGIKKKFDLK